MSVQDVNTEIEPSEGFIRVDDYTDVDAEKDNVWRSFPNVVFGDEVTEDETHGRGIPFTYGASS